MQFMPQSLIVDDNLPDHLATRFDDPSLQALDALPLSRVVHRSVADEVRAQLVALIESGQLQVSDRLPSEAELSRRFGVSRPIVREALGRLQALGLTESRRGSGTFVASNVTKLTLSFGQYSASDLNEVRRCLEVPAVQLAASRRTKQDIEDLTLILEQEESAAILEDNIRADSDFHCRIARATGNMLFVRLVEDLREVLHEQTLAVFALRNRGSEVAREHRAVLEAIVKRDSEAAAQAMDEHLDAVERTIRKLAVEPNGQQGSGEKKETRRRSRTTRAPNRG